MILLVSHFTYLKSEFLHKKNANALVTNGISVHAAPLWKQTKPPPTVVTLNASLRFKRGLQAIKRQQSPFIKDALVWMSGCFWAKSTNEIKDTKAVDEENDDGGHSVICQGVQISIQKPWVTWMTMAPMMVMGGLFNDAYDDDDDDQGVICQGVHQSLPKWPDRINGFEGPSPY